MVTMGYSIESLDVCFGNQLADSRSDIGGNLCIGANTRFHPNLSDRNLGVILCRTLRDCYMIQLC